MCLALWASVQIAGCGFLARVKLASEGVEADRLQKKGKYAEAVPLAQQAVKLSEDTFGATHPTTAASLNNLAELYRAMGDYAKAEPLYQRALAIREKARGPEHPDTATSLMEIRRTR